MKFPINTAGVALLKEFEGWAGEAYQCPAGVWTIGYGFTEGVKPGDTMTREEGDRRLAAELEHFADGVLALLTREATSNQFAALVVLAFNIGLAGFARSTVLRLHSAGDIEGAARAFGMWNKAGGKVLRGLVRRRAAESALYLKPEIPLQRINRDRLKIEEGVELPTEITLPMPQRVDAELPMGQSRIMRASAASGGVATLALAAEGAEAVGQIRYSLGEWLPYVALAAVVVFAGWAIWERLQQRRRGVA